MKDKNEFDYKPLPCPNCGADLKKVGIYELATVSYKIDDNNNPIVTYIDPYDVGVVCGECNEDIDVEEVGIKFK